MKNYELAHRTRGFLRLTRIAILFAILISVPAIQGRTIQLDITGHWTAKDFKVTQRNNTLFDVANPKYDGAVFGFTPGDGSLTLTVFVDSADVVFYPAGTVLTDKVGSKHTLKHDFYGYRKVTFTGDTVTFGNAVWQAPGILGKLEGPGGTEASLWTDADVSKQDPSRVSFRMFGKADGLTADLFVGSRTPFSIGNDFLVWEYYQGEEIRSNKYSVKARLF